MDKVLLTVPPSSSPLGWLLTVLATVFAGVVREFLCRQLESVVRAQAAPLLSAINSAASVGAPLLGRLLNVELTVLPPAAASDLLSLVGVLVCICGMTLLYNLDALFSCHCPPPPPSTHPRPSLSYCLSHCIICVTSPSPPSLRTRCTCSS